MISRTVFREIGPDAASSVLYTTDNHYLIAFEYSSHARFPQNLVSIEIAKTKSDVDEKELMDIEEITNLKKQIITTWFNQPDIVVWEIEQ